MSLALHKPSVLVGLVYKNPLAAEDLVSSGFRFIDHSPRFKHIEMLIDVSLHLVPELPLETMASELSIALWRRWKITSVMLSSLKSRLPCLRNSILVKIKEPLLLLTLQFMNNHWLDVW